MQRNRHAQVVNKTGSAENVLDQVQTQFDRIEERLRELAARRYYNK